MASEMALSSQLSPPHLALLRPLRRRPGPTALPSLRRRPPPSVSPFRAHLHIKKQRKVFILRPKATEQQGQVQEDEMVDSNVLPYCSIDKKAKKKTLGEMEQDFLQALQSFYFDKEAIMSNEEFDNLKEELTWEGSSVVMLSPDEQKFLEASMAFAAGKKIMTDAEFDQLKLRLKQEGSSIVQGGPRCSLRSRKEYWNTQAGVRLQAWVLHVM